MNACVLERPGPVANAPLRIARVADPVPKTDELLVRVNVCAVCRTDLHVVEGDLAPRRSPVIPGHQVVGIVERTGPSASTFRVGDRVGIAWLHRTCGQCGFCRTGRENLCSRADFTGYSVDGGFAELVVAPEAFVYPLPAALPDEQAAPLLCAGIIGYRSLKFAGLRSGRHLGFFGFGGAAHLAIQTARHAGARVSAITRDRARQESALALGAEWAGADAAALPSPLDAAIVFAPAGELVLAALRAVLPGGSVVLAGIHMTQIPAIDFALLYPERSIQSVANNTREDGREFLRIAAEIPIRSELSLRPLREANRALETLAVGPLTGSVVLDCRDA